MKKRFQSLTLMLATASAAIAAPLSPEAALARLNNGSYCIASQTPTLSRTISLDGEPTLYLFNSPGGWMIVTADQSAPPLAAYGDGRLDDALPPALEAWLEYYSRCISESRRRGGAEFCYPTHNEYQPIEPLLDVVWSQNEPFNDLCPTINNLRCVVGCVATAMAQVLTYYQYPEHGIGSNSYTCWWDTADAISFDFEAATFDWDNMLPRYEEGNYSPLQAKAAAELSFACGISVNMSYGTSASGAFSGDIAYALSQYLGYNGGINMRKRDAFYPPSQWDNYVYTQLTTCGPLIYTAVTENNEGHAFVIDGYSADGFFHINWGWGGLSNGYFLLDLLDPEVQGTGGSATSLAFKTKQCVVADMVPSVEPRTEYIPLISNYNSRFAVTKTAVALGERFTIAGQLFNEGSQPCNIEVGYALTSSPNDNSPIEAIVPIKSLTIDGISTVSLYDKTTMPSELADGTYCMKPIFRITGTREWHPVQWSISDGAWIWVTIADNKATFSYDEPAAVERVEIDKSASSPAAWYTLQGQRVSHPKTGVYIRVDDGGACRVRF